MRKNHLDILKVICVFLLIPFHHLLMYNNFGFPKYVIGSPSNVASLIVAICIPWYMKLLFVIAGMSTRYSLNKRSGREYIVERFLRIALPFFTGLILLVPFLSYIGDITNKGYTGGYLDHYNISFIIEPKTYRWGLGTSHLWFLEYLFFISLIAFPIYLLCKKFPKFFEWSAWSMSLILLLGVLYVVSQSLIQAIYYSFVNYYSLSQYLSLFLLGMLVLSHNEVQAKLEKHRFWLLVPAVILCIVYSISLVLDKNGFFDIYNPLLSVMEFSFGYLMILTLLGHSRRYLNTQSKILTHSRKSSMLFYIFHYPILVGVAHIIMTRTDSIALQLVLVSTITFALTYLITEIIRVTPFVRTLFGMKRTR